MAHFNRQKAFLMSTYHTCQTYQRGALVTRGGNWQHCSRQALLCNAAGIRKHQTNPAEFRSKSIWQTMLLQFWGAFKTKLKIINQPASNNVITESVRLSYKQRTTDFKRGKKTLHNADLSEEESALGLSQFTHADVGHWAIPIADQFVFFRRVRLLQFEILQFFDHLALWVTTNFWCFAKK